MNSRHMLRPHWSKLRPWTAQSLWNRRIQHMWGSKRPMIYIKVLWGTHSAPMSRLLHRRQLLASHPRNRLVRHHPIPLQQRSSTLRAPPTPPNRTHRPHLSVKISPFSSQSPLPPVLSPSPYPRDLSPPALRNLSHLPRGLASVRCARASIVSNAHISLCWQREGVARGRASVP